jgi:hypothetical protein
MHGGSRRNELRTIRDAEAASEELANDLLVCTSQTSEISGKVAL